MFTEEVPFFPPFACACTRMCTLKLTSFWLNSQVPRDGQSFPSKASSLFFSNKVNLHYIVEVGCANRGRANLPVQPIAGINWQTNNLTSSLSFLKVVPVLFLFHRLCQRSQGSHTPIQLILSNIVLINEGSPCPLDVVVQMICWSQDFSSLTIKGITHLERWTHCTFMPRAAFSLLNKCDLRRTFHTVWAAQLELVSALLFLVSTQNQRHILS